MTKEELKQEAEESFKQYKVTDEDYVVSPYSDDMGEKMLMYNYEYYAEETYSRFYTQGYLASAEPREKQIADLEKENERLTDELKTLRESIKDYGAGCYENGLRNGKRKLEEQLTKAKELLKQFLNAKNGEDTYKAEWEAEQFISEVEK